MNYQKVIEELEHHARESADFLAGFQDADEMESENCLLYTSDAADE